MGLGAVAENLSIHDNIQAFGRLLQSMLPEEALSPEQPASSIVMNCLAAGSTGYDSMSAVCTALDEALALELDQPQPARSLPALLLLVGGIVLILALLAALVILGLGSASATNLSSSTPMPTPLTAEETTAQRTATPDILFPTSASMSLQSVSSIVEPGDIRLVSITYAPAGGNANEEYVVIENRGNEAISLTNWRLEDAASRAPSFTFPQFTLTAEAQVKIWTGKGANSETDLYWGSDAAIWVYDGDTASLYDEAGTLVDRCSYDGGEETAVCQ
jgi:hypothetical protein